MKVNDSLFNQPPPGRNAGDAGNCAYGAKLERGIYADGSDYIER